MRSLKSQHLLFVVVAIIVLTAPPASALHQPVVEVKVSSSASSITVRCDPAKAVKGGPAVACGDPIRVGTVGVDANAANISKDTSGNITVNFPGNIVLDNTFRIKGAGGATSPQGQCVVLKGSTTNQVKVQNTKVLNESTASTGEAGVTIECNATIGQTDTSIDSPGRAHGMSSTGSFYRKQTTLSTLSSTNLLASGDDHTANASFFYFRSGGSCPSASDPDPSGAFPSNCVGGRNIAPGPPGTGTNSSCGSGTPGNQYCVPNGGGLLGNSIANGINVQLVDHDVNGNTIVARCGDFFSGGTCLAVERLTAKLFYNLAYETKNALVDVVDRAEITASGNTASGPPLDLTLLLKSDSIPGITWHGGDHQQSGGVDFIDVVTVDPNFNPASIVCDFNSSPIDVPVLVIGDPSQAAPAIDCQDGTDSVGNSYKRIKFDAGAVEHAGAFCTEYPGVTGILLATADFKVDGTQVSTCKNNPNRTCTAPFGDTVQTLGAGQFLVPINPCNNPHN